MNYYRLGMTTASPASTKQAQTSQVRAGAETAVTDGPIARKAGDSPLVVVGILAGLLGLTYGVVPLIHKSRTRKIVHTTYRHPGGYKAKGKVIDV